MKKNSCGNALYFFGMLGSAIYYLQNAGSFSEGLVGIIKALVWPAFLIHRLFGFLGM